MSARSLAGLAVLFAAVALVLAGPALEGEFLSDDFLYIVNNPYVHGLSLENVRVLLDPWGPPTIYTLNYAPVHLLLHAAEWHVFGDEAMTGWHVVGALAHGLASWVLVLFLLRAGIPVAAAVFGGAFFLVHPANVEVSLWIFQLKTSVSLALALGALLLHPRRPGWATGLFALALLTKVTALFALPVALVQAWVRQARGVAPRWGWLAAWAGVFALLAIPEMAAFQAQDDPRLTIHPDPLVHARTIVAIAMRYLVMAGTSWGVAAFAEPGPALSWLDPWWLGGLVCLAALGWRSVRCLLRREEEAAMWLLAAASFAPVSQIFPFIFPMGDRYLYPILPGLIGGALLAAAPLAARLASGARAEGPRLVAGAAALAVLVAFAVRSHQRAPVFLSNTAMMLDASLRYPDGMQANLLRAHRAAAVGDVAAASAGFQRAVDLGFTDLAALVNHPKLVGLRGDPRFQAVLEDLARRDIARWGGREDPKQTQLMRVALAYRVLGRPDRAIAALERAQQIEGPFDDDIAAQLRVLRAASPESPAPR